MNFFLAKDETSPRLECKYAVKFDHDKAQISQNDKSNFCQTSLFYYTSSAKITILTNHIHIALFRKKFILMVTIYAFTQYVAHNRIPQSNAYYAHTTLYEHWIAKFGLPEILVTVNGTEFINIVIMICHLYKVEHKSRTSHALWTNGLVEGMNRSLHKYLRRQYQWKGYQRH